MTTRKMPCTKGCIDIRAPEYVIGPGFDCLGIALALYNKVTICRAGDATGGDPEHPMVAECARHFFKQTGQMAFGFQWSAAGEVPVSRGSEAASPSVSVSSPA